jgi:hypothetical protein
LERLPEAIRQIRLGLGCAAGSCRDQRGVPVQCEGDHGHNDSHRCQKCDRRDVAISASASECLFKVLIVDHACSTPCAPGSSARDCAPTATAPHLRSASACAARAASPQSAAASFSGLQLAQSVLAHRPLYFADDAAFACDWNACPVLPLRRIPRPPLHSFRSGEVSFVLIAPRRPARSVASLSHCSTVAVCDWSQDRAAWPLRRAAGTPVRSVGHHDRYDCDGD